MMLTLLENHQTKQLHDEPSLNDSHGLFLEDQHTDLSFNEVIVLNGY